MSELDQQLRDAGIAFLEYGITALDAYYDELPRPFRLIAAQCTVIDLARIFKDLEFPGLPYADASWEDARFICVERLGEDDLGGPWLNFSRDPRLGTFFDRGGIYEMLRGRTFAPRFSNPDRELFDTALLSTLIEEPLQRVRTIELTSSPSPLYQRDLILGMLAGPHPASGFEYLKRCGFVAREWPELAQLDDVDHSKEFHPEGNGWTHTMQTFSYRKDRDLTLSLALLLHDIGKPESRSRAGKRFDKHAELGAKRAATFMSRLGVSAKMRETVEFLIRYHMMPAALPVLPVQKTRALISDVRFPILLELFRCDEFSSFKDPERYYEACGAYHVIKKNLKNPYRNADGSKKGGNGRSASHF